MSVCLRRSSVSRWLWSSSVFSTAGNALCHLIKQEYLLEERFAGKKTWEEICLKTVVNVQKLTLGHSFSPSASCNKVAKEWIREMCFHKCFPMTKRRYSTYATSFSLVSLEAVPRKPSAVEQKGILSWNVVNREQNGFKSEIRFDLCLFEKFRRLNHL